MTTLTTFTAVLLETGQPLQVEAPDWRAALTDINRPDAVITLPWSWYEAGQQQQGAAAFRLDDQRPAFPHIVMADTEASALAGAAEDWRQQSNTHQTAIKQDNQGAGMNAPGEPLRTARAAAAQYREEYPHLEGGVVLVWNGEAYGWKDALRDPEHERPGVYAVGADGRVSMSTGGDTYNGAQSWEAIQ